VVPPTRLETPRLFLRQPTPDDAASIYAGYARDPEVTRYVIWQPHPDLDTTRAFVQGCVEAWGQGTRFPWVITTRSPEQLIGMIELRIAGHRADLGYVLARPHWGRGLATEAVRAVVGWALDQPEIHRVWAVCDVENVASARVLEKAGMQREGILRRWLRHPGVSETPRDCLCYARIREPGRSIS
jgi:[ribosomal protein S5]-alanine N-acetyltransferase